MAFQIIHADNRIPLDYIYGDTILCQPYPNSGYRPSILLKGNIASLDLVNEGRSFEISYIRSAIGGAIGALLGGWAGALAGLLLLGFHANKRYTFSCILRDGRWFVATASPLPYKMIQNMYKSSAAL